MPTVLLAFRLIVALLFVAGVLYVLTRAARAGKLGFLLGTGNERDDLEITAQRALGRHTSVALLRAGDRHLLIGVSDQGVQLLAEGPDLAPALEGPNLDLTEPTPDTGADPITAAGAHERADTGSVESDRTPSNPGQAAPKHLPTTAPTPRPALLSSTQPRMTLIESLRELTVRKP